jgi:hypothetical protein
MSRLRLRCGERHPDRQDAVVLRGMAVERRSRPARLRMEWVSPLSCERAGDKGCPLVRQGGERLSACATKATQPFERQLSLLTRSVTRPSLGPRARARRSSLTSSVKAVEGGALGGGSRLGKPGNRRNQHRTLVAADEARLDAHSDSRKRDPGASEKEGGCGLRPFEELESPGRSARTSYAVAEVVRGGIWSRISSRAAPSKRERDASERGPSSG